MKILRKLMLFSLMLVAANCARAESYNVQIRIPVSFKGLHPNITNIYLLLDSCSYTQKPGTPKIQWTGGGRFRHLWENC